jgi:hypothetical protein
MDLARHFLDTAINEFKKYKDLGDKTLEQMDGEEMHWHPDSESNSTAIIIQHLAGNFRSRWTDFLTTDGEKPDRNRDSEFEDRWQSRETLLEKWEQGWHYVFNALELLKEADLMKQVTIRSQPHTVLEAICRSLEHTCYHIGQMVYLGKQIKREHWKNLSVPKKR